MENKHTVTVDKELCIGCGLCVKDCCFKAINIKANAAEIVNKNCIMCGHCVAVCPMNAVLISGFTEQPEAIVSNNKVDSDVLLMQLKSRRTMRHFTKKEIPEESIQKIIEAGRYTPTGSNKQTVSYTILKQHIDDYEKIAVKKFRQLKKIADIFTSNFRAMAIDDNFLFKDAPVVLVVKSTDKIDGALAASSMELMAQSLGLGALYSGFFTAIASKSHKLKKMLKVSKGEKVVATLVLGYPAVKYVRTAQRENAKVTYD